eukprot:CAMPEP_0176299770 /NCGR_PEP_ID=MMETSP0121_2-20121125/59966_1 /TAXON_ID=160619 /ORGANISM="Kryptoperidinium foliaceum, Strain CCMP 1326" /LENGTH=194 /DNA_ID=CAMNT_0017641115 /DNA_START=1 /DNA_END=586 /DNA_ORIENTATION=+
MQAAPLRALDAARLGHMRRGGTLLVFTAVQVPLAVLAIQHWRRQQSYRIEDANTPFIIMCAIVGALLVAVFARSTWRAQASIERSRAQEEAAKARRVMTAMAVRSGQIDELFAAFDAAREGHLELGNVEDQACVVCLQADYDSGALCVLACGHMFHKECVRQWWLKWPEDPMTCLICRRPAMPGLPEVVMYTEV